MGKKLIFVGVLILGLVFTLGQFFSPKPQQAKEHPQQLLIHILNYVSFDYSGAVKDGVVLDENEYKEQVEFIGEAKKQAESFGLFKEAEYKESFAKLEDLVINKAEAKSVEKLAQDLAKKIVARNSISTHPVKWPDLARGQSLFASNCVSCHGDNGHGDGRLALRLDPKPANFHDAERMDARSPFQVFTTLQMGVSGTAMSSYRFMPEDDLWALAFYVISLRHKGGVPVEDQSDFLVKASELSDLELLEQLPEKDRAKLAAIRTYSGENKKSAATVDNPLNKTKDHLNQSVSLFEKGEKSAARQEAVVAYLQGFEQVEKRLKNQGHALLVSELEKQMMDFRALLVSSATLSEVNAGKEKIFSGLDTAGEILDSKRGSSWFSFAGTVAIMLREGFEAILIVIALLGVVRASGSKKAEAWIHGGWITALGVGVAIWFLTGLVMDLSGFDMEMLEGITSVVAVVILLYMGFWLHSRSELAKWHEFIHQNVQKALDQKNLLSLWLLSFIGVFREAFETVLFLKALWLEGGMGARTSIILGLLASIGLLSLMAILMLKFAKKLPIPKLFAISSGLMVVLAVILGGKGIHAFQETGLISRTVIPLVNHFEFFGVFPTIETLLAQLLLLLAVFIIWRFTKQSSEKILV